jgi:hypothetical protein
MTACHSTTSEPMNPDIGAARFRRIGAPRFGIMETEHLLTVAKRRLHDLGSYLPKSLGISISD